MVENLCKSFVFAVGSFVGLGGKLCGSNKSQFIFFGFCNRFSQQVAVILRSLFTSNVDTSASVNLAVKATYTHNYYFDYINKLIGEQPA